MRSAAAAELWRRGGPRVTVTGSCDLVPLLPGQVRVVAHQNLTLDGRPVVAGIAVGRESGEFTPHVLRHTAGTTLTRAGTNIVIVAEILGHSVETARRYALPSEGDRQEAIERLPVDR